MAEWGYVVCSVCFAQHAALVMSYASDFFLPFRGKCIGSLRASSTFPPLHSYSFSVFEDEWRMSRMELLSGGLSH